jgi:hypothetical protein
MTCTKRCQSCPVVNSVSTQDAYADTSHDPYPDPNPDSVLVSGAQRCQEGRDLGAGLTRTAPGSRPVPIPKRFRDAFRMYSVVQPSRPSTQVLCTLERRRNEAARLASQSTGSLVLRREIGREAVQHRRPKSHRQQSHRPERLPYRTSHGPVRNLQADRALSAPALVPRARGLSTHPEFASHVGRTRTGAEHLGCLPAPLLQLLDQARRPP